MLAVTTTPEGHVGLDVHARSVVACGLDGETGEVLERRLTPEHRDAGLPAQRQVLGTRWRRLIRAVFGSYCVRRIDSRHEHGENSTLG